MKTMPLSEARNDLPSLVEHVSESHETVIITRHGKPLAQIGPVTPDKKKGKKEIYPLRGVFCRMSDDFNEPMPELWNALV